MAIIKLGMTVVGIRGTVGGGVFSANKSGAYVKTWTYPVVKRTNAEQVQRARTAEIPTAWRALSQSDRDAYNTLAASGAYNRTNSLGETYQLSGYQLFASWARIRQTALGSIYTATPTAAVPTPPPDVATSADESAQTMLVTVTSGDYTTPYRGYIEAQPIRSPYLAALPNRWRFMNDFSIAAPTSRSIATEWLATYGAITAGQPYAVRLRRMNNQGSISTALTAIGVVVA